MRRFLGFGCALALAVPLLAQDDSAEENRRLLEKWRADPVHAARLQHDLAVFQRLSPERQQRLRKLDRDLQEENPALRARLGRVLQRYTDWLDRLPEAERRSIEQAPDRKARLERIAEIRRREWTRRLPQARREQLAKLPEDQRKEQTHKLWQEQWESRADWLVALRHDEIFKREEQAPVRLAILPADVQKFYEESLRPLLSKAEEKRLRDAEGKWPRYLRTLVELADTHPLSVLGPIGPTGLNPPKDMVQLPPRLKEAMLGPKASKSLQHLRKLLEHADGRWPEAGVVLRDWASRAKKPNWQLDQRFMPSHAYQLPPFVQQFLEKRLLPALDEEDRVRLKNTEGHWPAYPRLVIELAHKHNLTVPTDKALPGAFKFWDAYRVRSVTAPLQPGEKYDPLALSDQ